MSGLWWMYTIVLGGAFSLVARSIAEEVKIRRSVPDSQLFLTAVIWQVFLLLLIIQVWIAFGFYQRSISSISVVSLLLFLSVPVGIFVMVTILYGNYPWRPSYPTEQEVFDRSRPVFFGVLIAMPLVNIVHEVALGNAGFDSDLMFQLLIVVGGIIGLVSRSRRLDNSLGIAMIAVIATYILIDYGTVSVG